MIDKDEALRRLHEHAQRLDATDSPSVELIADAVGDATATGLAASLRALLEEFLDEVDNEGRDVSALLLADVAGTAALPDILTALHSDSYESRHELSELAERMIQSDPEGARAELIAIIADGSSQRCADALLHLEPLARAEDVALLATTATRPDPAVRRLVAQVLPDPAHDDAAFTVLIGILSDEDADVRISAIGRLAETGRSEAVEALAGAAADPEHRVRARIAHALGRLGLPAAQPVLAALLQDTDERVRGQAGEALGRIGGDPAIGLLLAESAGDDPRQRVRAAKALAHLVGVDPRVEPRIRALAADADAGVRAAVLSGLATVGDVTGRWSSLVGALAVDPDVTVRHRVAGTVVHLHPYPRKILTRLSSDPSGFVREAAAEAGRRLREG